MSFFTSPHYLINYAIKYNGDLNSFDDYEEISRNDNKYLKQAFKHGNADAIKYILNHKYFKYTSSVRDNIEAYCDRAEKHKYGINTAMVDICLQFFTNDQVKNFQHFDYNRKLYAHIFAFDDFVEEFKTMLKISDVHSNKLQHIKKMLQICATNNSPKCAAYIITKYTVDFDIGFNHLFYFYIYDIPYAFQSTEVFKNFIAKMNLNKFKKYCLTRIETEYPNLVILYPVIIVGCVFSYMAIIEMLY